MLFLSILLLKGVKMDKNIKKNRLKSLLALLLLVPVPSIGAYSAMIMFPNSSLGQSIFLFSKIWLFTLPVLWHFFIDKEKISFSPAKKGGYLFGSISGTIISIIIILAFILLGDQLIDKDYFIQKLSGVGLNKLSFYIGAALYWTLINSVLEEYVWRWFVVKKCEMIMKPKVAIIASAIFFTLHHIVALSVYFNPLAVTLCSLGVFIGGIIWSFMYVKYRSIWPGYLSHAIVDLAIFIIGGILLLN